MSVLYTYCAMRTGILRYLLIGSICKSAAARIGMTAKMEAGFKRPIICPRCFALGRRSTSRACPQHNEGARAADRLP
jgi:hypothetical protein